MGDEKEKVLAPILLRQAQGSANKAGFLGYVYGALGSSALTTIGYAFGKSLSPKYGEVLGWFFGACSYVAMASLQSVTANRMFIKWSNNGINLNQHDGLQNCLIISSAVLASFSAFQFGYVTGSYIRVEVLGLILAFMGFSMVALFNYVALERLMRSIRSSMSNSLVIQRQQDDLLKLSSIQKKLYVDTEIRRQVSARLSQAGKSARKIYDELIQQANIIDFTKEAVTKKRPRKLVAATGFFIGAWVAYSYFVITLEMIDWLANYAHIAANSDAVTSIKIFTAVMASVGHFPLGGYGVMKRFTQLYDVCTDKEFRLFRQTTQISMRRFGVGLGIVAGGFAAIPLSYLTWLFMTAHQYSWILKVLLTVPTFLGPAAVRSDSFQKIYDDFIDVYRVRSGSSNTESDHLDALTKKIEQLKSVVTENPYAIFSDSSTSSSEEFEPLLRA